MEFFRTGFRIIHDRHRGMNELIKHRCPMFDSDKDLDLNPQIIDGNALLVEAWHADGILLRREDAVDAPSFTTFQEPLHLAFRVAMMVGIALC